MEEKLRGILNHYEGNIQSHERKRDNLLYKINFCKDHNFEEEVRVLWVEFNSVNCILNQFREMHEEITLMLDTWES